MLNPAQNGDGRLALVETFIKEMRLLPNSERAFRAGMQLRDIDGIGGIIALKIPEKLGAPLDVATTVGRLELILR